MLIGGKEVGLKDKSTYKKSSGDEAATKSLGMGVISHNIQGPMKFAAWSSDVKFEGENVTRNLDMTTHNHLNPAQVPTVSAAAMQPEDPVDCKELTQRAANEREKLQREQEVQERDHEERGSVR